MNRFAASLALTVAGALLTSVGTAAADPLGGKEAWDFTPQNRAAIAVAIKNIEDPGSSGGGGTTIVCGGTSGAGGEGAAGSASSATANSACIIVSNSSGAIVQTDQDSDGDQDADSETSANNSVASKKKSGSIDDVASILSGDKQGH